VPLGIRLTSPTTPVLGAAGVVSDQSDLCPHCQSPVFSIETTLIHCLHVRINPFSQLSARRKEITPNCISAEILQPPSKEKIHVSFEYHRGELAGPKCSCNRRVDVAARSASRWLEEITETRCGIAMATCCQPFLALNFDTYLLIRA